jgi:hypothetical protein
VQAQKEPKIVSTTIPAEVKRLLDGANFAHLATLLPDGSPQSAPATHCAIREFRYRFSI